MPISINWNVRNGYDEGKGPSQCFQEVRETVVREIGNCEPNVSANPEATDTAVIIPDELGEFFVLIVCFEFLFVSLFLFGFGFLLI